MYDTNIEANLSFHFYDPADDFGVSKRKYKN